MAATDLTLLALAGIGLHHGKVQICDGVNLMLWKLVSPCGLRIFFLFIVFHFNLCMEQKLGFASCKRNSGATEGINVLMEKKNLDGRWAYGLSCIEYTEFDKYGIADGPHSRNRYVVISFQKFVI